MEKVISRIELAGALLLLLCAGALTLAEVARRGDPFCAFVLGWMTLLAWRLVRLCARERKGGLR